MKFKHYAYVTLGCILASSISTYAQEDLYISTTSNYWSSTPLIDSSYIPLQFAMVFEQTHWVYLLCLVIFGLISFFSLKNNIRQSDQAQQYFHLWKKSQQRRLQSQMNPHFIFNALHSVQEYYLLHDPWEASEYLGKFAELMRLQLNQTNAESIGLDQELNLLTLYISLEKLRFDSVKATIEIDPLLQKDSINFAPMLIQPYVENVFKHAFTGGNRHQHHLKIAFIHHDKNYFRVVIEDNGIGIHQTQKIDSQNSLSFSTKTNQKRLALLASNIENKPLVITEDLSETSSSQGTRVQLFIPITP